MGVLNCVEPDYQEMARMLKLGGNRELVAVVRCWTDPRSLFIIGMNSKGEPIDVTEVSNGEPDPYPPSADWLSFTIREDDGDMMSLTDKVRYNITDFWYKVGFKKRVMLRMMVSGKFPRILLECYRDFYVQLVNASRGATA